MFLGKVLVMICLEVGKGLYSRKTIYYWLEFGSPNRLGQAQPLY